MGEDKILRPALLVVCVGGSVGWLNLAKWLIEFAPSTSVFVDTAAGVACVKLIERLTGDCGLARLLVAL